MEINRVLKLKHAVWASAALFAIFLAVAVVHLAAKPSAKAFSPPTVEVAQVTQQDIPVYGEWIGTLDGLVNAEVKAQVAGYLLRQQYKEGSFVKKGQSLFEIDPRPFQAALDQAEGQLAEARAQVTQDEAQLASAEAEQVKSQLDVEKYTPLAKAEAASQQDLDNASQTNLGNRARVLAAKAAIDVAKAQIQAANAAVETAKINLDFTHLVSPIDGVAGVAQLQVGALVSGASGPVTTVSTLDPIKDYFTVGEQEYLELQKRISRPNGQQLKLQLILADGTAYPREGTFYFADRAVDQNTGAIRLAGLFPNPGNVLRPGQYGKVRAVVRTQAGALLVPQPAVTEVQGTYQVDVVGEDNKISVRPVKVGRQIGTMWIVLKGLHPGERVIVEGQQNLSPGMAVEPKPFVTGPMPSDAANQS
jgi:membrane fusion protein (multidrug efflux system)